MIASAKTSVAQYRPASSEPCVLQQQHGEHRDHGQPQHGQRVGQVDQLRRLRRCRGRVRATSVTAVTARPGRRPGPARGRPGPRPRCPRPRRSRAARRPRPSGTPATVVVPSASGSWWAAWPSHTPGPSLGGEVLGEQHLDALADPVLGALRGQLLDQVGDPPDAGVDLGLVELAGQADRLGALLVGVAEDPDRVEAALGEEALELGDVVLGLARGSRG